MKYIIILFVALCMNLTSVAEVKREGNTFKVEKVSSVNQDTQTPYTWETKDGQSYPIFITKKGSCYIKRVSKKDKEYKQYLPKETQQIIQKELGYEISK